MRGLILALGFVFLTTPVKAAEAVFAAGCFWCIEADFEAVDGVIEAVSGYMGGELENPTYKQVSAGGTGHKEVVKVIYDPQKISYKELLDVFWVNIDPFDDKGQFCDKGDHYKAAIFYSEPSEQKAAFESKDKVEEELARDVVTEIIPNNYVFYEAEEYHQDYYKKNSWRYGFYRSGCGRDKRLKEVWGEKAGGKN
jgi:peptide-methionine (S)-S-oxide reductase